MFLGFFVDIKWTNLFEQYSYLTNRKKAGKRNFSRFFSFSSFSSKPKRKSTFSGGGGNSIVFSPSSLDPLRLPVWRHIVTGKSLGSLVQISKEYDSYLDERGRGKAKKLANIAIYPLLIWSNVYELWCCYNLPVSTVLAFCVRDCIILLICFAGRVAGSPSISRDRQGYHILNIFFL